jgi:hypothetical protein
MDRLTWCKENLENLQLEIANDPKYVKLYALSAIVNQMLEWMHRKEDLENINEMLGVVVIMLKLIKESDNE